jgi:hypothetical protein
MLVRVLRFGFPRTPRQVVPDASNAASGLDESVPKQIGVQLTERGRSLRTGKSVPVIRFLDFHMCP